MKLRSSISVLLVLITTFCFAQKNMPLVGNWKMISGKTTYKDSTINNDLRNVFVMKIVTPTNVTYFAQNMSDSSMLTSFVATITMDDKNYKEQITCASSKDMLGYIGTFTYKIEGDKWHLTGGDKIYTFDEVWQRIK